MKSKRHLGLYWLIYGLCSVTGLVSLTSLRGLSLAGEQRSVQESHKRFPKYHGEPLPRRPDLRDKSIPADRPLSLRDLNYLLELGDFLIDTRNDPAVRKTAARHIGHFGHKYAIPPLLAVLRDEDAPLGLRAKCVGALSKIHDRRVIGYLIEDGIGSNSSEIARHTRDKLLWMLIKYNRDIPERGKSYGMPPPPSYDPDQRSREEYDKARQEYFRKYQAKLLDDWRNWWEEHRDEQIEFQRTTEP